MEGEIILGQLDLVEFSKHFKKIVGSQKLETEETHSLSPILRKQAAMNSTTTRKWILLTI